MALDPNGYTLQLPSFFGNTPPGANTANTTPAYISNGQTYNQSNQVTGSYQSPYSMMGSIGKSVGNIIGSGYNNLTNSFGSGSSMPAYGTAAYNALLNKSGSYAGGTPLGTYAPPSISSKAYSGQSANALDGWNSMFYDPNVGITTPSNPAPAGGYSNVGGRIGANTSVTYSQAPGAAGGNQVGGLNDQTSQALAAQAAALAARNKQYSTSATNQAVQGVTGPLDTSGQVKFYNADGSERTPTAEELAQLNQSNNPQTQSSYDDYMNDPSIVNLQNQLKSLNDQYAQYANPGSDETNTSNQIQAEEDALKLGETDVGDQPIPLSFITGQQAALEKRSALRISPLQTTLANLQAKRSAAADVTKSQLANLGSQLDLAVNAAKDKNAYNKDLYSPQTIGNQIIQRQPDGSYKAVYTAPQAPLTPDKRYINVGDGSQLYDTQTGKVVSNNPKTFAPSSSSSDVAGFTQTQLNKGAANSGLAYSSFKSLSPDVQNFYVNTPASTIQDFNSGLEAVKSGKAKATDLTAAIDSGGYSPAVASYLKSLISQSTPASSSSSGNPLDSIYNWFFPKANY